MATPAQIAANRRNALKSTGPRTEAGKSVSKMNAVRHGIDARSCVLPGEDPDEFAALAAGYRDRYNPHTPEQDFLVDTLAQSEWNRRRYARIQADLTAHLLDQMEPERRSLALLFLADTPAARALNRVIRRYEAAEASWFRALRELRRIIQREEAASEMEAKAARIASENPAERTQFPAPRDSREPEGPHIFPPRLQPHNPALRL
jgi:hypothetical protein